MVGRALVHEASGAVLQRPVDDVAVAGNPADVGGAPVNVFVFQVEDPFCGEISADRISSSRVDYAFGFSSRAGSVEDIKWMLGVERLGRANVGGFRHQLVPPVIASGLSID